MIEEDISQKAAADLTDLFNELFVNRIMENNEKTAKTIEKTCDTLLADIRTKIGDSIDTMEGKLPTKDYLFENFKNIQDKITDVNYTIENKLLTKDDLNENISKLIHNYERATKNEIYFKIALIIILLALFIMIWVR